METKYKQLDIDDVLLNYDKTKPLQEILIINGTGGVGKNEFVRILNTLIPLAHESVVNPIKKIAKYAGWNGEKDEASRTLLYEFKKALDTYNDYTWNYFLELTKKYHIKNGSFLLCVDMREHDQIERAKKEFGAKTVLVLRNSVTPITSNAADADVFNTSYDYIIDNNGDIEDLKMEAIRLLTKLQKGVTDRYGDIV